MSTDIDKLINILTNKDSQERILTLANLIKEKKQDILRMENELQKLVGITNNNTPNTTPMHPKQINIKQSNDDLEKLIFNFILKNNPTTMKNIREYSKKCKVSVTRIISNLEKRNLIYCIGNTKARKIFLKSSEYENLKIVPGYGVTKLKKKLTPNSQQYKIAEYIDDHPLEIFNSSNQSLLQFIQGKDNRNKGINLAHILAVLANNGFIQRTPVGKGKVEYTSLVTAPTSQIPTKEEA